MNILRPLFALRLGLTYLTDINKAVKPDFIQLCTTRDIGIEDTNTA